MSIRSKYKTPNATTGGYDVNHFETELQQLVDANSAAAHNALYRGKDLTSYFESGEMSQAIANGNFKDIFPGDYITKNVTINGTTYNVKWIVGDLNYHKGHGDAETTANHVLMFAESRIFTARMNATDITTGGYTGSEMWGTTMPLVAAGIKAAFGASHVLKHRELLTKAENDSTPSMAGNGWNGAATNWEWVDVEANIFNEPMVYGGKVFSSSFYDVGDCTSQIAAFRHNHELIPARRTWNWLRAVVSSSTFAVSSINGYATYSDASDASGGVRPYFLLR